MRNALVVLKSNDFVYGQDGSCAMSAQILKSEDVEALAKSLGVNLKAGNSAVIASMLWEIRQNVYRKASVLVQDAPLSVFFDAR